MAGSRTLKLSILGDVSDLNKSLKAGAADVDTFGDKVGKAGKMIGAAFAAAAVAAAAYAVKIGIDGVKAAIEDEKAQTQLALALENATGATKAQIAETEKQILKVLIDSNDNQKKEVYSKTIRECIDLINEKLVNSDLDAKDKLLRVKDKLLNDKLEINEEFEKSISKLIELRTNLISN